MPSKASTSQPDPANERTRLHITPFNPTLLAAIIPPSILPVAKNISYHSLETFPEKEFGFVDLPVSEAKKIQKKLNGAILRGTKIMIEEARPMKKVRVAVGGEEEDEQLSTKPTKVKSEKSKKRKRGEETISGVELENRKVKRGWAEPVVGKKRSKVLKDKKEVVKSKYTTGPECLFRTTVAVNKMTVELRAKKEKRKGKKGERDVVVHEFAKTTKHATFLRSSGQTTAGKGVVEFVENRGWVDEVGNVIERVPVTAARVEKSLGAKKVEGALGESSEDQSSDPEYDIAEPEVVEKPTSTRAMRTTKDESETSSSGTSSDEGTEEDSSESESESDLSMAEGLGRVSPSLTPSESDTSSSGTSSSEEESSEESDNDDIKKVEEETTSDASSSSTSTSESNSEAEAATPKPPPKKATQPPNLSVEIPQPTTSTTTTKIHPLEALYKRRNSDLKLGTHLIAPNPLPAFSFFDNNDDLDDEENQNNNYHNSRPQITKLAIPMTPFTEQDFASRHIRSAAPTPDTAFPGKSHASWPQGEYFPNPQEDIHENEEGDGADTPTRKAGKLSTAPVTTSTSTTTNSGDKEAELPQSDFQKWFYEHRGEANRAWKKRRREAAKEKRHRENKRRGERAG